MPQQQSAPGFRNDLDITLEKLRLGSWSLDIRSGAISASDEQARIFGYTTPPEWTLDLYLSHILPEDRERNERFNRELVANPRNWTNEYRIRRVDGSIRWLQDIGGPEFDEQGNVIRLLGVVRDVTEIKTTERKLRDLERHWDFATHKCRIGLWKIDLKTMILSRNDEHARIYGESVEARPTLTIPELLAAFHIEDRQRVQAVAKHAFAEQEDYAFEARIHRADGTVRWVNVIGVFQFDDAGRPVAVLGSTQDVTGQKEMEIRQREMEAALQQAQKMELLGQLAGGIAHDFNNVLTAIQGNADLILKDTMPESPHYRRLTTITNAVGRSAEMVRQLLAFARKQPVSQQNLELDAELDKIYLLLRKLIREEIALHWQLGCPHLVVKIDPANLVQIITNLIVNARDAIEGHGSITIDTALVEAESCEELRRSPANSSGSYLRIRISDTGTGIDPDVLPHIFEPFFTTKEVGKGTGLGLPTVYGLVKQNNGFVACRTETGAGTTFELFFPAVNPGNRSDEAPAEDAMKGSGKDRMVLVVEDEPEIASIITTTLEEEGFCVLAAKSAEEAIDIVENSEAEPCLLVSDIMLPSMNGVQMSRTLLKRHPQLRFLFISGYNQEERGPYGELREGGNFISKPFTITSFLEMVHTILERGRA